jgi:hypothetical protein
LAAAASNLATTTRISTSPTCSTTRPRFDLVNVWLQSRSLPARGRVGLEVHRCLCIIDAGNVFISTVMG